MSHHMMTKLDAEFLLISQFRRYFDLFALIIGHAQKHDSGNLEQVAWEA